MAIQQPASYGLIVRCGPFTRAVIRRLEEQLSNACQDDAELFGVSVGDTFEQLLPWIERLERAGLQRGGHYVITLNPEGVIGDMPRWLECRESPSGRMFDLAAPTTSPGTWSTRLTA